MVLQEIYCIHCLNHIVDLNDLDSCTSLGGINIRMLGFVMQVRIYTF